MNQDNGNGKALVTKPKWALVVTHMLNPNMVQGFPMHFTLADDVQEFVQDCLSKHTGVPVRNADGETLLTVILGPGMTYQIEDYVAFATRMKELERQQAEMAKQQAEAAAANKFGITPGGRRG